MCDSLGISDTKIRVYKFTMLGQTCIFKTKADLKEAITIEIDDLDLDDTPLEIEISSCEMKESDFENLPEFDGY